MHPIARVVREELAAAADEKAREVTQRFFREPVACYGVKSPEVRRIAGRHGREVRTLGRAAFFSLCEELLASGLLEEASLVSLWAPGFMDRFGPGDLPLFRAWIEKYLDNWAKVDTFCNHTIGDLIAAYPDTVGELEAWARSPNRWLRRAAAVSLIIPAKGGLFLPEALAISEILLEDGDDMVQKGYGWLLKEASRLHRDEVFRYVLARKDTMPRTALRYAIELMPREMRRSAMKRG